jgi:hypothetical protein
MDKVKKPSIPETINPEDEQSKKNSILEIRKPDD